jgi:hypothetical protein
MSIDEMQELLGDLNEIEELAVCADEIIAVQKINKITNSVISLLKKAVAL